MIHPIFSIIYMSVNICVRGTFQHKLVSNYFQITGNRIPFINSNSNNLENEH